MRSSKATLILKAMSELTGCNFGIQFENQNTIYVSPAIFSLSKTDFNALIQTLHVKEVKETDPDNPIKNRFVERDLDWPMIPKFNRSQTKISFQIRGGAQHGNGLLPDVFEDVDKRGNLRRL